MSDTESNCSYNSDETFNSESSDDYSIYQKKENNLNEKLSKYKNDKINILINDKNILIEQVNLVSEKEKEKLLIKIESLRYDIQTEQLNLSEKENVDSENNISNDFSNELLTSLKTSTSIEKNLLFLMTILVDIKNDMQNKNTLGYINTQSFDLSAVLRDEYSKIQNDFSNKFKNMFFKFTDLEKNKIKVQIYDLIKEITNLQSICMTDYQCDTITIESLDNTRYVISLMAKLI